MSEEDQLKSEVTAETGAAVQESNENRPTHPLQFTYTIWFNRRVQGARTQENYEKNIKKVGSFSTVEDFWDFYVHLVRPNDLPNTSDYHLFKDGIKPMWEDGANRLGGKWIVRLPKGLASRFWEDLILGVIGEQFEVGDEICGAVISIRYQEDIISLWTRNATDHEVRNKILETMKRILPLDDPRITVQYKNHDASIRDNSSFRNTETVPLPYGRRDRFERGDRHDRGERGDREGRDLFREDRRGSDRGDRERTERGERQLDREDSGRSLKSSRNLEREGSKEDLKDTRESKEQRDKKVQQRRDPLGPFQRK